MGSHIDEMQNKKPRKRERKLLFVSPYSGVDDSRFFSLTYCIRVSFCAYPSRENGGIILNYNIIYVYTYQETYGGCVSVCEREKRVYTI